MDATPLVLSRAEQALRQSPIPALRKLSVEEKDGVIVIAGSVSCYYYKQLAQEAVLTLRSGKEVSNRVTVVVSKAR